MLEKDAHDVFEILQQLCTGKCAVPSEYLESPNSGSDNAEAVITLDHAREVTRYGGVELHNISSMMGGIAAQEAVKMITNIYSPLNNTYFFNGIQSVGATYTF